MSSIFGLEELEISRKARAFRMIEDFLEGKIKPSTIDIAFGKFEVNYSIKINKDKVDIEEKMRGLTPEISNTIFSQLLAIPGVAAVLGIKNVGKIFKQYRNNLTRKELASILIQSGFPEQLFSEEIEKEDKKWLSRLIQENLTSTGGWVGLDTATLYDLPF